MAEYGDWGMEGVDRKAAVGSWLKGPAFRPPLLASFLGHNCAGLRLLSHRTSFYSSLLVHLRLPGSKISRLHSYRHELSTY